jgi:hypothetical protein
MGFSTDQTCPVESFFPSAVNEMTFFMFLYLGYPSTKYCSNTSKDKENQKQTAQGNHQGDISFFSELKMLYIYNFKWFVPM